MLRIEAAVSERNGHPRLLRLDGRLIGVWVGELERACQRLLADEGPLALDLSAVSFVDQQGAALLQDLADRDVVLLHRSPFVTAQMTAPSPVADAEERAFVARLRAGEPAAIEALMAEYAGSVYRLVSGITRNAADAEEVVQDVFLTVCRKIDTFEGRSALRTWIYRIAVTQALNKRRGKRREVEVSIDEHLPTFRPDGHRAGDAEYIAADWSRTPDEELLAGATREALRQAIDELPDDYRAVLVMRDVEALSNAEVARILGESVGAVKSRLHRARMVVRERLTTALHVA